MANADDNVDDEDGADDDDGDDNWCNVPMERERKCDFNRLLWHDNRLMVTRKNESPLNILLMVWKKKR